MADPAGAGPVVVDPARQLAARVLAGDPRAGARLMRLVDDEVPLGLAAMAIVHKGALERPIVGITGAPGSGKSTLVNQLIRAYRAADLDVGVVAVDPTSPLSGGAVLADRVRMQEHILDEGVFIRSLATRGHKGGLSASASATARILEAMAFDRVLVETVGIGQSEVEIARLADTVVAVLVPGMGDDIQAMKAGLLEVPDIFVVNKSDREGADLVVRDLQSMIRLAPKSFGPPVMKTVATTGEGVDAVVDSLARHHAELASSGRLVERRRARAMLDLETALTRGVRRTMLERAGGEGALAAAAERIRTKLSDPWTEVALLLGTGGDRGVEAP